MIRRMFGFLKDLVLEWHKNHCKLLEAEYGDLQRSIDQCVKENVNLKIRLDAANTETAITLREMIKYNNEKIDLLSHMQETIELKLGYIPNLSVCHD
jgi:hypothetical protein